MLETEQDTMDDNSSMKTTRTSETVSTVSSQSTKTYVVEEVDLEKWKLGNVTRYVLPQMIHNPDRSGNKSEGTSLCSDAIAWNVVFIKTCVPFPSTSPPNTIKMQAAGFVQKLKMALNKVCFEECQRVYWSMANESEWEELRGGGGTFMNFTDLVNRTVNCESEMVRRKQLKLGFE